MKRIVCFGDSNTWGYDPKTGQRFDETTRWPMVLQQKLGKEYQIIEEGQSGRSIALSDIWEGGTKCGLDYLLPMIESHTPFDLLIVMLGTNDLKGKFSLSAEDIAGSMETMIFRAKSLIEIRLRTHTKIMLVSPPHLDEKIVHVSYTQYLFGQSTVEQSQKLSSLFEIIAQKYACSFFDAATATDASKTDGLHLNEEGHRKLADAIATQIRRII